jgi:predicted component of type VI protein secretion system
MRVAGGFLIRDCSSRAGIRVNGESVAEAGLRDGDMVQIGPFSFRAQLPQARQPLAGPVVESRQARLERKRANLVRLALAQRRRLQQLERALADGPVRSREFAQLAMTASGLRRRVREFQQRLAQLEEGERELLRSQENLRGEQLAVQEHARQAEAELARGRAELAREAARLWDVSRQSPVPAEDNPPSGANASYS